MHPKPSERYYSFARPTGANFSVGVHLLPHLRRLLARDQGVILDLGCGSSPFRLLASPNATYLRMDKKPLEEGVQYGTLESIPLPDGAVDVVLLSQALTDVFDTELCLTEIRRVLRPEGQLLVFESMCYPEHDAPNDYFRIMPAGISEHARRAGFAAIEVYPLGGLFTRVAMIWCGLLMQPLTKHWITRWPAKLAMLLGNATFVCLDKVWRRPRLASDYLCVMTK